jgi:THAP domain
VFRFPKDAERKQQWLRKIPQELLADEVTDAMVVCERHFEPRFILREYVHRHPDGTTFTSPRDLPVLDAEAVPTIFPNLPSYLSTPLPAKRKAPDARRAEMTARDDVVLADFLKDDIIPSYNDFFANVHSRSSGMPPGWTIVSGCNVVLFMFIVNLATTMCPSVATSFKVWSDMRVSTYDCSDERDNDLCWLLGDDGRLSKWSQLPNICAHLQNKCVSEPSTDDLVTKMSRLFKQLIRTIKDSGDDRGVLGSLQFLYEQFGLAE